MMIVHDVVSPIIYNGVLWSFSEIIRTHPILFLFALWPGILIVYPIRCIVPHIIYFITYFVMWYLLPPVKVVVTGVFILSGVLFYSEHIDNLHYNGQKQPPSLESIKEESYNDDESITYSCLHCM